MKASTRLDPSPWREEDDGMVRSQPSGILKQECLAFQFPGFEPAQLRNLGNHGGECVRDQPQVDSVPKADSEESLGRNYARNGRGNFKEFPEAIGRPYRS
ncbi:hypothetical protein L596_013867 [Steinernema carpocapsae]|uniref:Uncharacterized protein n=1 Tax=Steinernema carpocapsae TaxID=34508 RepID=A0A4U5P2T7_STECR|nr:hypothetical protein L596_013867 [Steinernema carpocapsae]